MNHIRLVFKFMADTRATWKRRLWLMGKILQIKPEWLGPVELAAVHSEFNTKQQEVLTEDGVKIIIYHFPSDSPWMCCSSQQPLVNGMALNGEPVPTAAKELI